MSTANTATSIAPKLKQAAGLIKLAADPTRLSMLALLANGERFVSEIGEALGIESQPAVSHHLSLLTAARIIERRRNGKRNYYTLTATGQELAAFAARIIGEPAQEDR